MSNSGNWFQIYLIALLTLCSLCCQDANCVTCDTYIGDTSGNLVETCSECISGFKLQGEACVQDNGLIIGIAIGAAVAVVAQIGFYIYCKLINGKINKKKVDISLEEIYRDDSNESQKGGDVNHL